jgi:putative acetyl-CoA carboxylase, biotin carboxyl carrier protein
MELKDIQELMKVLKKEELTELKVRYGKVKLTLTNLEENKQVPVKQVEQSKVEKKVEEVKPKEEIIKSQNVGRIKLGRIEKGTAVEKGTVLAKISTIGIDTDVKSTVKGVIKEILVSDQAAVDFAKPLFVIEI